MLNPDYAEVGLRKTFPAPLRGVATKKLRQRLERRFIPPQQTESCNRRRVQAGFPGSAPALSLKIHPEATKEELLEMAKEDGNVSKWLEGKSLVKEIVVPGKLVNFVVK